MSVTPPTATELCAVSEELGLSLSDEEARSYLELISGTLANFYDVVDAMPDNLPPVRYARTPGYRPQRDENPYNAWYVKTTIEGARNGKLEGKRIAVKDNVCVADVPMMVGASTLEGYVPDVDAASSFFLLCHGRLCPLSCRTERTSACEGLCFTSSIIRAPIGKSRLGITWKWVVVSYPLHEGNSARLGRQDVGI